MEKLYKVIYSNPTNHIYDKLLCVVCNGVSLRNNFSTHKKSNKKHLAILNHNKNIIAKDENNERVFIQPPTVEQEEEEEEEEENYYFKDIHSDDKLLMIKNIHNRNLDSEESLDIDNFINYKMPLEGNYINYLLNKIKDRPF